MASPISKERTLKFTPLMPAGETLGDEIRRNQVSPYKFALLAHDLLVIFLAFAFGVWIAGLGPYFVQDWRQSIILFIPSLIILGFFPTYNLFNYHAIFLAGNNLLGLVKAFALALLTLSIVGFLFTYPEMLDEGHALPLIFIAALFILLISRFFRGYRYILLLNLLRAVGMSFLAIGMIGLLSPDELPVIMTNPAAIPIGFFLAAGTILISRYFLVQKVFNNWMRQHFRRQIVVVGSDQEAKKITNYIIEKRAPFWVVGIVGGDETRDLGSSVPKINLGKIAILPRIVREKHITELIVTDDKIDKAMLIALLDFCISEGLTVWFPPKLMPIIGMKLYINNFCGIPMIRLCSQRHSWVFNKIKHVLDALFALPIALLLLPLFLVLGIAIKLNSKGPIFYQTTAIGKNSKEFKMFKFRSMRVEEDVGIHKEYVTKLIKGEINQEGKEDQVFKITDDPRITSIGKFIRKFSIDELPQIINVLKGDMSFVGPRPCLPYEYKLYQDWQKKRFSIRPGITGLWQVTGRSTVTFKEMILLDQYYIYNRSLLMDVNIIYETIFVVLGKYGAY